MTTASAADGRAVGDDAGGARRVYLLHGLLGTAYAHFGAQIRRWRHHCRLVAVDLPGHGRCPRDAAPAYLDEAYAYVSAVIRHFGPGHVVATSYLSGPLGVRSARDQPELVRSLTLTGFVPGLPREVFGEWCRAFRQLAGDGTELADEFQRLHGSRWRATLAAFLDDAQRNYDSHVLVRAGDLGALPQPTLIANGSWKELERNAARAASTLGPRVTGRVITGGGHVPAQDEPDGFDAAVTAFWRDVEETCPAT